MKLNVFFTPSALVPEVVSTDAIYIVIDVIRATTTITMLFNQRARRVLIAQDIEQARHGARFVPGRLLCGERNVQPIPGFDYGNSPAQFSKLDLTGSELILTTTNGTRAFHACPEGSTRLAGCFYNAHAVTAYALSLALEQDRDISIVCSGEFKKFALDDTVCAGYLVQEVQSQYAAYTREAGHTSKTVLPLNIDESAEAAQILYQSFKQPTLIEHSDSARTVIRAGLVEDIAICMQIDGSTGVAHVVGREEETGLLIVETI